MDFYLPLLSLLLHGLKRFDISALQAGHSWVWDSFCFFAGCLPRTPPSTPCSCQNLCIHNKNGNPCWNSPTIKDAALFCIRAHGNRVLSAVGPVVLESTLIEKQVSLSTRGCLWAVGGPIEILKEISTFSKSAYQCSSSWRPRELKRKIINFL